MRKRASVYTDDLASWLLLHAVVCPLSLTQALEKDHRYFAETRYVLLITKKRIALKPKPFCYAVPVFSSYEAYRPLFCCLGLRCDVRRFALCLIEKERQTARRAYKGDY